MRIIASYKNPKYYCQRSLCGINTYATKYIPDGYETKNIVANNFDKLKNHVEGITFYSFHGDSGRPLRMSDLIIKVED